MEADLIRPGLAYGFYLGLQDPMLRRVLTLMYEADLRGVSREVVTREVVAELRAKLAAVEQFPQFLGRALAEGNFGARGVIQHQGEAVTGVGDDPRVHSERTMSSAVSLPTNLLQMPDFNHWLPGRLSRGHPLQPPCHPPLPIGHVSQHVLEGPLPTDGTALALLRGHQSCCSQQLLASCDQGLPESFLRPGFSTASPLLPLRFVRRCRLHPTHPHLAGAGPVQPADKVQQRGLARTGTPTTATNWKK